MNDVNFLIANKVDVKHGLELLGDMETYNSIINDFYDAYSDRMQKINSYKNSVDMANYAIEVHSLKSDSKYLGFMDLADIAYKHEMASKANDIATVNNSYNDLLNEASRIIRVVGEYLGKATMSKNPVVTPIPEVNPQTSTPAVEVQFNNPSVEVPVQENIEVISPEVVSSTVVSNSRKAILVADDSSIIRNFVNEIFSNDYNVLMAGDGKEVINIVSSNDNIVALLLDLNMPGVSGFDVLEYFKENDLFKKIPVSIISGASDKESIDNAFKYPIVDMLNKPFARENVKLVVEKTIEYGNM